MKKLLILLVFPVCIQAQNVFFADPNFKAAVIATGADWDSDGEISLDEAAFVAELDLTNQGITNLAGIESFSNLQTLKLNGNPLTSVNLSANVTLLSLDVTGCPLSSLDLSGLSQLMNVVGGGNTSLAVFDFTGCTALTSFQSVGCQALSLDFSTCPNINNIYVPSGQLISMTFGPSTAGNIQINCSQNHLIALDVSTLTGLRSLICDNNQIATLDLSNNVNLQWLGCAFNQLSTLDVSNSPQMAVLGCDNNNLTTLFIKNGANESVTLANNPNLAFVCADTAQIVAVQSVAGPTVAVDSYCSFTPGGDYNTITGVVRFDANNNGCDASDLTPPYIKVGINGGSVTGATFTNIDSVYDFYTAAGSFAVMPDLENPSFFTVSPATANINFPDTNNNIATQNFCIAANGVHKDLEIVIAPVIPARPGFDAVYKIVYRNKGNQTMGLASGISMGYDQTRMTYVSADIPIASQTSGIINWDYANLRPFESKSITVTFHIHSPTDTPAVNVGDVLQFTAAINPVAGDETFADNDFGFPQTVVGSFDPNSLKCVEGDVVPPSQIGNYLHYMANFENTGTDVAENIVVVTDVNQAQYDINSLRVMNSSHPAEVRVTGNKMECIFHNINLSIGGHGNILLKMKSQGNLVAGNTVTSKADIYFDYNLPVATNFANTTFQMLGVDDHNLDVKVSAYPNPAHGPVNITASANIKSVQMYDVQGRILQISQFDSREVSLDLSARQTGVYFLKIFSDSGTKTVRIVKN